MALGDAGFSEAGKDIVQRQQPLSVSMLRSKVEVVESKHVKVAVSNISLLK
jgi:hypothetical protein